MSLDDHEDERCGNVERGNQDDQRDDEKAHAPFERQGGEELSISFLPVDCRVAVAKSGAQLCSNAFDVINVANFDANHGGRAGGSGKGRRRLERQVDPSGVVFKQP